MVRMMGGACSTGGDVHVRGTYNGVEFVNGPVTTHVCDVLPDQNTKLPWYDVLAQFETDTDITGEIPVVLTCTGGLFYFRYFRMNYSGPYRTQQPTNPDVPVDPNDPSTYSWVVTVPTADYYGDPNVNTLESDGVFNLTKNGSPWTWRPDVAQDLIDNWGYPCSDGDTISFNFFIDPARVRL
jgi:hypothetical protein